METLKIIFKMALVTVGFISKMVASESNETAGNKPEVDSLSKLIKDHELGIRD